MSIAPAHVKSPFYHLDRKDVCVLGCDCEVLSVIRVGTDSARREEQLQLGSRINSDRPALVVDTDTVAVKDNEVSHRQEKEGGGSDRGGEGGGEHLFSDPSVRRN